MVKALGGVFLWSFKEKASAVSRDTAFSLGSVIVRGCFISTVRWKYSLFSSFPFGGLHGWGVLLVIPSERHRKRHQPFSMTQPFLYGLQPVGDTKYPKQETTRYMGGYYLRYCYRAWVVLYSAVNRELFMGIGGGPLVEASYWFFIENS